MAEMPRWQAPQDLERVLHDDGVWEDERWSPIHLTAMSGTEWNGREIPIAWQIEFDSFDEQLESANARIAEDGAECDGYGWGERIMERVRRRDPALATRLHLTDCEAGVCVVWVEAERDCRLVLETVWRLIHEEA